MKDNNKNKEYILYLLQLIRSNGSIYNVLNLEYSHKKLTNTLFQLQKDGYIEFSDNKLSLTNKGNTHFEKLNKELEKKGLYKYLTPRIDKRIKKMDKEEIFVPLRFVSD